MHSSIALGPFRQSSLLLRSVLWSSLFCLITADYVRFHMQELIYDCPSNPINPDHVSRVPANLGQQLRYHLRHQEVNQTSRFFLAKPYRVREAEFLSNDVTDRIVVQEGERPYIYIKRVNANHRGNYSLYRFEYDGNNRLLTYGRLDFYLVVEDLKLDGEGCRENYECKSNHCWRGKRCVCTDEHPIFEGEMNEQRCYSAKGLNESCELNAECQYLAGPGAECFAPWRKCRCNQNTVPIRISGGIGHCVSLHVNQKLNTRCLFSRECSINGPNRYCNADYRCDCLPGYNSLDGRHCTNRSHRHSPLSNTLLLVLGLFAFSNKLSRLH